MRRLRVKYTYRDYLLLPEEKRYEIVGGELWMAPSPLVRHQRIVLRIARLLDDHVRAKGLGEVFIAPLDVVLSEEDVVQPDILFIRRERLSILESGWCKGPPDLVVEVLSPATAQRDRELKRKLYANFGVSEYWLVDPDSRRIEVLRLGEKGYELVRAFRHEEALSSPLLGEVGFPAEQALEEG